MPDNPPTFAKEQSVQFAGGDHEFDIAAGSKGTIKTVYRGQSGVPHKYFVFFEDGTNALCTENQLQPIGADTDAHTS